MVKHQVDFTFKMININHIKKSKKFWKNKTYVLFRFINYSSILNQSIGNLDILLRDVKVDKIQN